MGHIFWSRTQKGGPYLFFGARRIKVGRDFYGAVLNFLWRSMHSWVHFLRSSMQKGMTIFLRSRTLNGGMHYIRHCTQFFMEQYAKRSDNFVYGEVSTKVGRNFYGAIHKKM